MSDKIAEVNGAIDDVVKAAVDVLLIATIGSVKDLNISKDIDVSKNIKRSIAKAIASKTYEETMKQIDIYFKLF